MTEDRIIGIDVGVTGALALVTRAGALIEVADMPVLHDRPANRDGAKDAARAEAIRRWPDHASLFARVKDDGRAEAALIAIAGLKREGGR